MKKNILGIMVLFAIVITACAQQKKTTTTTTTTTTKTKTKTSSKPAQTISYIQMRRTACFGKCPVYYVELYKDGLVRYTSQMFTEHEGIFEKNIGAAKVDELFKKFSDNHVDTCSAEYKSYIQDLPGIQYTIKYGTKEQQIKHANFGPGYLTRLAEQIDGIATIDDTWKKTGEQPKPGR